MKELNFRINLIRESVVLGYVLVAVLWYRLFRDGIDFYMALYYGNNSVDFEAHFSP